MNGRKNGTKNERSYGRCGGILFLATRRLDFGQSIAGMGPTNVATFNFGAGGSFDPTGVWVSEDSIG
jgi:hypothetical protein